MHKKDFQKDVATLMKRTSLSKNMVLITSRGDDVCLLESWLFLTSACVDSTLKVIFHLEFGG